jgi:hypothetical protein
LTFQGEKGMETNRGRSIVGVFDSSVDAERALAQLRAIGAGPEDVSVMMRDTRASEEPAPTTGGTAVAGGAATGATLGGLLGGLAGWMVAIGAIAIPGVAVPGVGTIVGGGILASTLAGLAIGAATGGLIGALLGLGVPEEDAREYEAHLKEGRILVTVHPTTSLDANGAANILQANGAYDVRVYDAPAAPGESTPQTTRVAEIAVDGSREEVVEAQASAEAEGLGSGAAGGYGTGQPLSTVEPAAPRSDDDEEVTPNSSG